MSETRLWYRAPATGFLEALPLGNGRLGAMVYGQATDEVIELNEDTLWTGGPGDRNDPTAAARLPALRRAVLRDGDHLRADELARRMQGPDTDAYQPLGSLLLTHDSAAGAADADYRRELNLSTAVHTVRCGSRIRRTFVSAPAGVLAHHLTGGGISFTARLTTPHPSYSQAGLTLGHLMNGGMGFVLGLRVLAEGGEVRGHPDGSVTVTAADTATVLVAAATGFRDWRTEPTGPSAGLQARVTAVLDSAAARRFADLQAEHTADHARLFDRAGLDLRSAHADLRSAHADLPTDERLAALRAGAADPGLSALHFGYGRYLLIACSRPGTQPANLQGIWNRELRPPWNCDWTTNINTQMNYWPAEPTNLAECHEPLFDLVTDLAEAGQRTARGYYDCDGWAVHHNVDLWRSSNPVQGGPQWANWPQAGPWLCAHLWQHYLYSGDRGFLAERAYPAMRGAVRFLLDFLTEDADGHLVTCPSTSPEHRFRTPDGRLAAVSAMTTMDYWLATELLDSYVRAAGLLGLDPDLSARAAGARSRLPRPGTGPDGALLEWRTDVTVEDPGHRHLSHLYGLYPGSGLTPADREPARRALRSRLEHGGGGTGWSLAWVAALAARLGDGDLAQHSLTTLLTGSTAANLLDLHPPSIFQIDGNLGATAAVTELLLQNTPDGTALLPALPAAWPNGSAHGLRAHGGLTVDLAWQDHALLRATLHTSRAGTVAFTVPARGPAPRLTGPDDRPVPATRTLSPEGRRRSGFQAQADIAYHLTAEPN
ncbi:glycosyl hydrolase family 95 catalytic domain-containing protein [Streptacidiphilus cavernicola]|uniref:Glycoside hydrolase N-terminal domain-containing protein n=1 Tax=Streptacidiphilus cavernicola TaxID=3342716 RepID=A0ABV6W505_9ACTN